MSKTQTRYPVMRWTASLLEVLAILSLVGGFVLVYWVFQGDYDPSGKPARAGIGFLVGFAGAINFKSLAEGMRVLVDIEHNTRRTAEATEASAAALRRMGKLDVFTPPES